MHFALTRALLPSSRPLSRSLPALSRLYSAPAPGLSEGEQNIHSKLTAKFSPSQLQVQDVSGGCGTFYAIVIASDAFKGLPIVKQHKLVQETIKEEIEGIHGLQIKTIPQ